MVKAAQVTTTIQWNKYAVYVIFANGMKASQDNIELIIPVIKSVNSYKYLYKWVKCLPWVIAAITDLICDILANLKKVSGLPPYPLVQAKTTHPQATPQVKCESPAYKLFSIRVFSSLFSIYSFQFAP